VSWLFFTQTPPLVLDRENLGVKILLSNWSKDLNPKAVWERVDKTIAIFAQAIFPFLNLYGFPKRIVLVFFLSLSGLLYAQKKKRQFIFNELFITIILSGIILPSFYPFPLYETYLLPIFPFVFILIAGVISSLKIRKAGIVKMILIFSLGSLFLEQDLSHLRGSPSNEFRKSQAIAFSIYEDYQQKNGPKTELDFNISVIGPSKRKNWDSPIFWYFLEEITHKKLIKLTYQENNIQPLVENPTYLYLICKDFNLNQKETDNDCLKKFLSQNNQWEFDQEKPIIKSEFPKVIVYRLRQSATPSTFISPAN